MPNSAPRDVDRSLLDELSSLVSRAGAAILALRQGSLEVRAKADHSPVTAADQASEAVMVEGISRLLPGVFIVSEEAVGSSPPSRLPGTFVLVDPLDGTREFIAGRDEFTINLALVMDGSPRLGIVAAPAQAVLWRGIEGRGAERLLLATGALATAAQERAAIHTRACPRSGLIVTVSRSHLDPRTVGLLARLPVGEQIACGSAVKFCRLAEGAADFYPRLSTTCEWDVAAGHAVLTAAGGIVVTPEGEALTYGHVEAGLHLPAFMAWGDPSAPQAFGLCRGGGKV